ncbi:MAG: hypothetical protein HXY50_13995 [Ignavibacteriaceae bacterium]|nr:hypothetical protein [Ignavibacteriaceae bacterium]
MRYFILAIILILLASVNQNIYSQLLQDRYDRFGKLVISKLSNAPFPHPKRINGHTYDNKTYSYEDHYSDSTVLIFIPKEFKPKQENGFVIHFHGWYNNVDSVLSQFNLIEQFYESRKNAILIIPQGPKNAPDSFGGKLEDENRFRNFISEITELLYQKELITNKQTGNIILSGHSGAYKVISFILMRGGLTDKIKEVFLFDGLYGQIEKYTYWLDHFNGKFINIYTKDGGTKDQSENLMQCLDAWKIPFIFKNEDEIGNQDLKDNKIVFIYSDLGHNEVIHVRSQFMKFLKTSSLEDK